MEDQVRHLSDIGGPAIAITAGQRGQQTHPAGPNKRQLRARLWLSSVLALYWVLKKHL